MESLNPFRYDGPVPAEDVIDRDRETAEIADLAEGGHSTRLVAPRRYGKTSLLRRVLAELDRRGLRTVYVDLYGVVSRAEIAVRVQAAYATLPGRFRRAVEDALRDVRLGLELPPLTVEVGASRALGVDTALLALLDVPVRLHARDGVRTVVVFDEFQDLLSAGDRTDALVRSRIQHHAHEAGYVFAGSQPGMMRALFEDAQRPFYRQAQPVPLHPLADGDLAAAILGRFRAKGREPSTALDHLLALARGHPQRAMQLAHHLFRRTTRGRAADEGTWLEALEAVRREAAPELGRTWDGLRTAERRVLAAVAWGRETLYNRRTLERFELSKGTARSARNRLLDSGELQVLEDGALRVTDPLLADWVNDARRAPEAGA